MTTHPDDVQRGALAWDALMGNRYGAEAVNELRSEVECILAAVLPAHDKRLRAQVLNEAADEIEFLFLPPPEFQGSEAVGLLRAANILRAASGERIGAAGYTQEDQDNLGQCGR